MDLKVLVIAADGNEADLPAIQQILDYLGTPYTLYVAGKTPGGLTNSKLIDPANSSHTYYQGVILTNSYLGYAPAGGGWQSALTAAEWTTLYNYETIYGIRQVSWYTYPTPAEGFNCDGVARAGWIRPSRRSPPRSRPPGRRSSAPT